MARLFGPAFGGQTQSSYGLFAHGFVRFSCDLCNCGLLSWVGLWHWMLKVMNTVYLAGIHNKLPVNVVWYLHPSYHNQHCSQCTLASLHILPIMHHSTTPTSTPYTPSQHLTAPHCTQVDPNSFKAWCRLGDAYSRRGKAQLAHLCFTRACELSPSDADAQARLVAVRAEIKGRWELGGVALPYVMRLHKHTTNSGRLDLAQCTSCSLATHK